MFKLALLCALVSMTRIKLAALGQEHVADEALGHVTSQTYVPAKLFDGTLYLGTLHELSPRQSAQLSHEFARGADQLVVLGEEEPASSFPALTFLKSLKWQKQLTFPTFTETLAATRRAELEKSLNSMGSGDCIWLSAPALPADVNDRTWLGQQLRESLGRGALVCLEEGATADETNVRGNWAMRASDLKLLPEIYIIRDENSSEVDTTATTGGALRLMLGKDAWLRVSGRELVNISEPGAVACRLTWPATTSYPEPLTETLQPHTVCDLVTAERARLERQESAFPADRAYEHRLANGSLVIVGGGGASREIWQKFLELAGGDDARIVILPTALPEPETEPAELRIFKRMGVEQVRVLTQIDPDEIRTPEYLDNLKWATGIWFGGGRQWRFVDAYWGTPAWSEIVKVVTERGGVIGGSSAGATIQGDLLVRGHPLGNHIMVADGYRHGLGLLPGVAIDQHFRQRNRFDDLAGVIERFPHILGIGIDEGTALVVQAPNRCQVIGEGSVWLSNRARGATDKEKFAQHPSGSEFKLP